MATRKNSTKKNKDSKPAEETAAATETPAESFKSAAEQPAPEITEIWVKRNKKNLLTLCFIGDKKVQIYPGINRIDDPEIIECIHNPKCNKWWNALLDAKVHELVSGKEENGDKSTTVFTAMGANDSIDLIKNTFSIPQLEAMHADESSKKGRSTVLAAIMAQIEDIRSPSTPEESEQ